MANTERPISFLKDDLKSPSSGVNPASIKESEFHVPAESFMDRKTCRLLIAAKDNSNCGHIIVRQLLLVYT